MFELMYENFNLYYKCSRYLAGDNICLTNKTRNDLVLTARVCVLTYSMDMLCVLFPLRSVLMRFVNCVNHDIVLSMSSES